MVETNNVHIEKVPSRKKRKCFFALMVFGLSFLSVSFLTKSTLNYYGYCMPEGRWLSDEEIIRRTVDRVNSFDSEQIPSVHDLRTGDFNAIPKKHYDTVPYDSVDEFLRENPDCCKFGEYMGEGFPSHFRMKIAGEYYGTMGIHFKLRYLEDDGRQSQRHHDIYVGYNNCGYRSKIEKFL